MSKKKFEKNLLELIRRTSTDLPRDVEKALRIALEKENKGSMAYWALSTMLEDARIAREKNRPICQDTGTVMFYFSVPVGFDSNMLVSSARSAVSRATRYGYLRENTVDAITGDLYSTNIANGVPQVEVCQGARKTVDVCLILKGGGSENVGRQYSLPDSRLGAGRNLEGVRKCILDAVWQTQGRGCSPGALGVCIGGDRAAGYAYSKEQFLRRIGRRSRTKALSELEKECLNCANKLKIGPMGLGGKTTLLDVKIASLGRLPASFFVSVSYMCWALRRRGVRLGFEGGVDRWFF
ncbi:MAG: fumarate hydratase [Verrucomicrobiota bacterium]